MYSFVLGTCMYLLRTYQYILISSDKDLVFSACPYRDSRISRLWQTLPTTGTCSCASYVSMLGLATSRHMRHSSRKLICILALHLWLTTSILLNVLHFLTVILILPARLGFDTLPWSPCSTVDQICCVCRLCSMMCIQFYVLGTN